ncbi:protein phosphatase methylesterase 1 isoform X2 [Bacillus rossius redtenbacheri]|uniref:protein phosphatase methylesterase 1 isoform X2 n=1 Tax=Bacillus rossius redtenbacheri TaxID=93214 RepID=UPI002FDCA044
MLTLFKNISHLYLYSLFHLCVRKIRGKRTVFRVPEMSALEKTLFKGKLPPTGLLSSARRGPGGRRRDATPSSWHRYFEESRDVTVNDTDRFRVYTVGRDGPVLLLLHGGGFSALTWALFSASVTSMVECRIVAVDLRGHGDTVTSDDTDLSAETMASMGGAIAVHTASRGLVPSLVGLAVIDVVEGTAVDSLASMQSFLRGRPTHFRSLEHAIEWCLKSNQVRNLESAKVSVPGQLKNVETGKPATGDVDGYEPSQDQPCATLEDAIVEEDSSFKAPPPLSQSDNLVARKYTWRIDLGRTEPYWPGWFRGLSSRFLGCCVPKMLLLAGVDRLDRDLTVGQMQGKFQMQVLPQCGHAVHEDVPDKVAEVVATFLVRHKFAEAAASFNRTLPAC